jgi:hypothetical protein
MSQDKESEIVQKIKQKKELSGVSDNVVQYSLSNYLSKYKLSLDLLSQSELKIIVKDIRAELRNLVGRFQISKKEPNNKFTNKELDSLLKTHTSTAERLEFYPELKKLISSLHVNSILDLACGLNPLALANKEVKYYASDINEKELVIIKDFFLKKGIRGEVFVYDLRKLKDDLPKADLCLLFKILDIIDDKKHKTTENILSKIPCKKVLVSFSTKKLSGKRMSYPNRLWFEKMLQRYKYPFRKIETDNEVFYLIDKNS